MQKASAKALEGPGKALADDLAELAEGNPKQIISAWEKAVEVQDHLNYNEPPDWYYTVRESLGYALLDQNDAVRAEKVFTEDLSENRLAGRSLNGLKVALQKQNKPVSAELEQKLSNAWRNATVSAAP